MPTISFLLEYRSIYLNNITSSEARRATGGSTPRLLGAYGLFGACTVLPFVPNLGPVGFNIFTILGDPTGFAISHFTNFWPL